MVVTLVESGELVSLNVPTLGEEVVRRGMQWLHLPIADFSIPGEAFEARWSREGQRIRNALRCGVDIVVHCKGGLGRAGMIAARLLVELGMEPKLAIRQVRCERIGAIETFAQLTLVRQTKTVLDEV
jgi:protein-tyrosine phosphatase